jgi:Lhr-like helicase
MASQRMAADSPRTLATRWLATRGWKPFAFQRAVWKAMAQGYSGLLHATTGAGKTYAVWLGALQALASERPARLPAAVARPGTRKPPSAPLTVLWITPMRALAADTLKALQTPLEALAAEHPRLAPWTLGARTGDTGSAERSAQSRRLPTVLVTTPESLSLLLARADAREQLASVRLVVADEWHELLGNKRGVQLQLALARLRGWNPQLGVWGMSATLGNLDEAMQTLLGLDDAGRPRPGVLVQGQVDKRLVVDTLLPDRPERFSWAGHLGLAMLPAVVRELESTAGSTLVFVNVRSQAELWYKALLEARPDWAGLLAIHHGSLDRGVREWVEAAAARAAVRAGQVEMRASPRQPVDVLVQHLATVALGGGFTPDALYAEVRRTVAFAAMEPGVWQWCLDFVHRGGPSLAAYPDYQRVRPDVEGIWRMPDARLARRHRANIGTIVSDASMSVQILHGARLGSMEESFLSRLSPGDAFVFAGQVLELVRIEDMTAYVRRAARTRATVPRWAGARMPLSTVLADFVVQQLALAAAGDYGSPELRCVRPLLDVQQRWSALPTPDTLLAETLRTREGWHLFLYPFAGRHAHIGLASLLAWRAAQGETGTFSIAVNDYGLELLSATERDWAAMLPDLLRAEPVQAGAAPGRVSAREAGAMRNTANADRHWDQAADDAHLAGDDARHALLHEVLASLNATEMARRRFREIARVSGLIFQSHPGERRSARQLQASAQLFFEVFRKYDDANLLLRQADEEVLSQELDVAQLQSALRRMQTRRKLVHALQRPSPFAFPLMVERFREKLTNEHLADRIARMLAQLHEAADAGGVPASPRVQDVVPPDPPLRPRKTPKVAKAPAEEQATAAVRRTLDFSLPASDSPEADAASRPRRVRKPSRPLPLL